MPPFLYRSFLPQFQRVLFYCLVLFLPIQLSLHFWPDWAFVSGIRVDYLSPTIYLTDVVVIFFLLTFIFEKRTINFIKRNRFFWFGLVFLVLLNSFFAIRPAVAVFGWIKYIEALVLGFVLSKKPQYFKSIIFPRLLLLTVIYVSLIGIAQYFASASLGGIFYYFGERTFNIHTPGIAKSVIFGQETLRPYSILPHPNVLAGYVVLVTLLLYLLVKWSAPTLVSVLFTVVILVLTQSTSAIVGLVLVISFLSLHRILPESTKHIFVFFVLSVLFISFVTLIFSNQVSRYFSDESLIKRSDLLSSTLLILSQGKNLFVGVGADNFVIGLEKYSDSPLIYSWLQPVHNMFLLLLSELGIIGFVFICFFASKLLVLMFKKNYIMNLSLLVFVFSVGLVDHYWLTLQQPLLILAISFGFLASCNKSY